MSDIHQEWHELRKKNGDFINHLDGEMAKLDKKQVELKRCEQMQHLTDSGAFAMQFVAPPPFNCCQDDRDILKALNKAQADRIKLLMDEITAYKEQQDVDLAVKKDLDEKLDKVTADYRALWVENDELKSKFANEKKMRTKDQLDAARHYAALENEKNRLIKTVSEMEKTIRDLDERNGTLRERLTQTNASLKRSVQESNKFQADATYLDNLRRCQAKEIKRLHEIVDATNGSCSASVQQGMQSKIAKQAAEIKRLIDDNIHQDEYIETLKKKLNEQTAANERLNEAYNNIYNDNKSLRHALEISAEDAKANFERGQHKGQEELWGILQDVSEAASMGFDLQHVYGYDNMSDVVANLTASAFLRKTEEDEKHAVKGIGVGDEVEVFDMFCPDDNPHSDIGIVVGIYEPNTDCESRFYTVIGPKFEAQINDADIQCGAVKKTGRRFAYIPLNYFD